MRRVLGFLKWTIVSVIVVVVLYFALLVAFQSGILIERDVRVDANEQEAADVAYEALGVWKLVFPNAPTPERATRDWGDGSIRYFWFTNDDVWRIFEDVEVDAIVAVKSGGRGKALRCHLRIPRHGIPDRQGAEAVLSSREHDLTASAIAGGLRTDTRHTHQSRRLVRRERVWATSSKTGCPNNTFRPRAARKS